MATLAVLLAGVVSIRLVRTTAEQQARSTLGRQADVVAGFADQVGAPGRRPAFIRALRLDEIVVVRVTKRGRVVVGGDAQVGLVTQHQIDEVLAGRDVSTTARSEDGARVFVEGRPDGTGGGVILLQPVRRAVHAVRSARERIVIALAVGLVGAAAAGLALSWRLARPLRRAAAAAHRMAGGARDVRLEPEGPAEVAELTDALNTLAANLATSEGRQREFLLSVSHELRTPLTAIKGYAEALADEVVPDGDVARTGSTMLAESERLERLVDDLLDLARLGAQDFRLDVADVDLSEVLRDACVVWADRCAAEGVDFRCEPPAGPLIARTDAVRIRQIIDGLAENALRVTPPGAPIVIVGRRDSANGWAVLEVRDGGPGLTADDQRVAFERSALHDRYRGQRRVGTGIGLALVGALVERLGGTATAGTAPEGGASFTIRLPAGGDPGSNGACR